MEVMWKCRPRCDPKPRNSGCLQKMEEARDGFSPRASEGRRPCWHLDFSPVKLMLNVWPPELWDKPCIYKVPRLLWKPKETNTVSKCNNVFLEYLLCAGHYSKCSTYSDLFNPHNKHQMKYMLLPSLPSPFYVRGNLRCRLGNLAEVILLVNNIGDIQGRQSGSRILGINHQMTLSLDKKQL